MQMLSVLDQFPLHSERSSYAPNCRGLESKDVHWIIFEGVQITCIPRLLALSLEICEGVHFEMLKLSFMNVPVIKE